MKRDDMTMSRILLIARTDVKWRKNCITNCLKYRSLMLKPIRALLTKPATPHVIPLQYPVTGKKAPQDLCERRPRYLADNSEGWIFPCTLAGAASHTISARKKSGVLSTQ